MAWVKGERERERERESEREIRFRNSEKDKKVSVKERKKESNRKCEFHTYEIEQIYRLQKMSNVKFNIVNINNADVWNVKNVERSKCRILKCRIQNCRHSPT